MDNKVSNWYKKGNFLSLKFETPLWMLTAIAVVFILIESFKITIPNLLMAAIALFLIIFGFVRSPKTTESTKELSDPQSLNPNITVSNFPENVNPNLLIIANRDDLKKWI